MTAGETVQSHFDEKHDAKPLSIAEVLRSAPRHAHPHCCGPAPMLAAVEEKTVRAGVVGEYVHVKYFTQKHETAAVGGFEIELTRSGLTLHIAPGHTILQTVLAAEVALRGCFWSACETKVTAGLPDHRDAILSSRERENDVCFLLRQQGKRPVLDLW